MVYPRQLTIQLRKRQLFSIVPDSFGAPQPIYYTGANPQSLVETNGTIDSTWFDFTDYVDGLDKLNFEWTVEQGDSGELQSGQFSTPKAVSGALTFERESYEFLKNWLVNDVAAPLNQAEARITDTNCGSYIGYVITSRQLEWCQFDALCVFDLNLKQVDDPINCIRRTVINDNWQGWFQAEPEGGKKHPRFSYCIEKRPNWTLVLLWVLTALVGVLVTAFYTVVFPILVALYAIRLVIYGLIAAINVVIAAVNTILPGTPLDPIPNPEPIAPVTPVEVFLNYSNLMIETAGCGREHPAPLIRDYLLNVCNKCGVQVDATTAPLFFAPIVTDTHSDNVVHTEPNPYYNACYLHATVKRGIRRFRRINLFTAASDPDTTTYFQTENAPNISGQMFLDEISKLYNQQWKLINTATSGSYLYIYRKDAPYRTAPIYDFSFGGADRSKIIDGICYQPQELNYPASCSFLYNDDPADKCGVEAGDFYNGVQTLTFGNTVINPIFEGTMNKLSGFSAAKFNCDGSSTNYLYDSLQAVYSIATLSGLGLPAVLLADELANKIQEYGDYKLLLQSETISLPKVLIWDGDTDNPTDPNYLNATAIRDKINIAGTIYTLGKSGWSGTVPAIDVPTVNPLYLTQIPSGGTTLVPSTIGSPTPWVTNHPPQTDVNMKFPFSTSPAGVYEVKNIFGGVELSAAAILVNYPMYFEPHYKETLWDKFHFVDDPRRYPRLNKQWNLKIPLCCEDIERLKLVGTINEQMLLSSVLLDVPFYNVGIITKIVVSYENDEQDGVGQYIELSGIV